MLSDVVTIVVTTGIGVGVIAGVLSGVCYILIHGSKRKRIREPGLEWHCFVCGINLRANIFDDTRAVICVQCEERVCRSRCAKREYLGRGWICYNCLKKPPWFQEMYDNVRTRIKERKQINARAICKTNTMKSDNETHQMWDKDQIRDFIEKLVCAILGENVDDASVFRTHKDKLYNKLFEKYYQDLCYAITELSSTLSMSINDVPFVDQTPSTAHSNLKDILENLLHDASRLPLFNKALEHSTSDAKEQTYEELLAAAILNKVIDKYQNKQPQGSGADTLNEHSRSNKKEQLFRKEQLEDDWHPTDIESNSISSLDEYMLSDSSYDSTKYVDRVSLTIRRQIEDLPPENFEENVEEERYLFAENTPLYSKDSNWYLQKRTSRPLHSPIPVPMLVPHPTSVSKVLIGDQEIDDTSDLSDSGDLNNADSGDEIQNFIIESKMTIEQNLSDQETSADSGVKEDRDDFSERSRIYSFPKADVSVDDENIEDVSLTSAYNDTENDSVYLTKYASLPGSHVTSSSSFNRYGRDYYKKQASLPSGHKKSEEVSIANRIDQLEAKYTYSSLPRSLYTSRNSMKNVVKNPLLNFPENYNSTL